jgi:hypothetical protein
MTETVKVLKRARPNGWSIRLEVVDADGEYTNYYVIESGDEDGVEFDGSKERAEAYYEERVAALAETPNEELQARYDEEHGTINGYSPFQFNREY